MGQGLERQAEQRFAVDGVALALGALGPHVSPAFVERPPSVGHAVEDRPAAVGQVDQARRERIPRRIFGPRHPPLARAAALVQLLDALPSGLVPERLNPQRPGDPQRRVVHHDLRPLVGVAVGVGQQTRPGVAQPAVHPFRAPPVILDPEYGLVVAELLDRVGAPPARHGVLHALIGAERAGAGARDAERVEVLGDPLVPPAPLPQLQDLEPDADLAEVLDDEPDVTAGLPRRHAGGQFLDHGAGGVNERRPKPYGALPPVR